MGSVYAKRILVTVEMAAGWLREQARNRPVNWDRVARYARAMRSGKWSVTNQGLGIGVDGRMIDGQHRCQAVVMAGVPVEMMVTFNLPESARPDIDGGKPRGLSDRLHMFGDVAYARYITSWMNAIYRTLYDSSHTPDISYDDAMAWYETNLDDVEFGVSILTKVPSRMRRKLAQASVLGSLVFAHRREPVKVRAFAERFAAGEGLVSGEPALALREFLLAEEHRTDSHTQRAMSLKTLRAARAAVEGQRVAKFQVGEEGLRFFAAAHTIETLPPPVLSNTRGAVSARDAALYEAVKAETSVAKIAAKLRAGGLEAEEVAPWCMKYQRYIPHLLQYAPSEVYERTGGRRPTAAAAG
jgi:hypothetical protein